MVKYNKCNGSNRIVLIGGIYLENKYNINLDAQKKQPLYMQIAEQIEALIVQGKIKPGKKLLPIRKLATELNVNPITVVNAYKHLEEQELAKSKVGSGTYVTYKETPKIRNVEANQSSLLLEIEYNEYNLIDSGQIRIKPGIINFASAAPSPELFPVAEFKTVLNEVLERDKGFAFSYQESQGYYPLRESITKYVADYNIKSSPENIQIISGAQQGIDIISKALIEPGDFIYIEDPSYAGAISSFTSRGAKLTKIPINPDGIDLNYMESKLRKQRPKFIYIMPCFQNPTGYLYSPSTRKGILDLADKYNFLIIEDDHLSDLSYLHEKVYPLKAEDKDNRVIYIKSFSKIFMPGLRIAFLIAHPKLHSDLIEAKHSSDISTSGFLQRAFDLYLRKGKMPIHIESTKKIYKERYDAMCQLLEEFMPKEIELNPPLGGLNFWINLPKGYSSSSLYIECLKKDILFVPGSYFNPSQTPIPGFRLSFAAISIEEIINGIETLAETTKIFLKNYSGMKTPLPTYIPFL